MTRPRFAVWTVLAALAAAGAARAQTAPLKLDLETVRSSAPLDLSIMRNGAGLTEADAEALRRGIAHTAVDHRFADRLVGSLGFLCDPQASMQYDRAVAMPGSDPQGKFLGAKLSFAFR